MYWNERWEILTILPNKTCLQKCCISNIITNKHLIYSQWYHIRINFFKLKFQKIPTILFTYRYIILAPQSYQTINFNWMSYLAGPNGIINTQKNVPVNWFCQFLKTPLRARNITTINLILWGIWDWGWAQDVIIFLLLLRFDHQSLIKSWSAR